MVKNKLSVMDIELLCVYTTIMDIHNKDGLEFLRELKDNSIDENIKVQDWNDDQLSAIRNSVNEIKTEGQLRSEVQLNIKRLMDIGCVRGIRHRSGLPLRGQRTKNNSRTRKGKRKTVANKKKATK